MIVAANLKTNHTRESFEKYLKNITCKEARVRIYPPASAFLYGEQSLHVKVGAQNFYPLQNGSCTGEIGADQLEEFNIDSVLIGHSERRHILKESDALIKEKFDFAKAKNWEVIFCIGEPKEVRESGIEAVKEYLHDQLVDIDIHYKNLIIAYEPVWAIGTGVVAQTEDIDATLNYLRTFIKAPLLYGGSVKPENVKSIYNLQNCDGVLVGTAAWEAKSFQTIIDEAKGF